MRMLGYMVVMVLLVLTRANISFAASCLVDLTGLQGQIQTEAIRQSLNESIDQKITNDGGLDSALEKAQNLASGLQNATSSNPQEAAMLADFKLIFPVYIQALQCRKNQ